MYPTLDKIQTHVRYVMVHIHKSTSVLSQDAKCYSIIILSCCFFSLTSLCTDLIEKVPVTEILWWRFFLSTLICLLHNQFTSQPKLVLSAWRDRHLLLSALFGTITATCTVFALRHLPIGEATLLLTTAPIFTVILSFIFLREQLQISDYLSLCVATGGVIFVAQPDFVFGNADHHKRKALFYVAIGAALTRGFFKAAKFVAVSVTKSTTPTHAIVLYLSTMGFTALTVINSYMIMARNTAGGRSKKDAFDIPTKKNMLFILLMAGFYFLQQLCVCSAMRYGKPAKASLLKYFDIVLPFLFQVTIFKQYPNKWSILGCLLIVSAMLAVISVKRGNSDTNFKSDTINPPALGSYSIISNEELE